MSLVLEGLAEREVPEELLPFTRFQNWRRERDADKLASMLPDPLRAFLHTYTHR